MNLDDSFLMELSLKQPPFHELNLVKTWQENQEVPLLYLSLQPFDYLDSLAHYIVVQPGFLLTRLVQVAPAPKVFLYFELSPIWYFITLRCLEVNWHLAQSETLLHSSSPSSASSSLRSFLLLWFCGAGDFRKEEAVIIGIGGEEESEFRGVEGGRHDN